MTDLLQLYTENYKLLFRIVFAFVRDIEDTKDILQEVFIRAYKSYRDDIPSDKVLAWVIVIAKNEAKTHLKLKKPELSIEDNDAKVSYELDCFEFMVFDALNALIMIIPQDLREPLKLHLTENMSLKKIAQIHGVVYSRIRYWKKILIKSLEPFI